MLSELLSANLCTPFLLPMVEGQYHQVWWSGANNQDSSPRQATKKEVQEKPLLVYGLVIWSLCSLSLNSSLRYYGVVSQIDMVEGRSLSLVLL
jgi:hypothetical protein